MLKKNRSLKSLVLCLGLGYSAMSLNNSSALDLESKVENAQEYCLKNQEKFGSGYSVFNINGNMLEIQSVSYDEGYVNYHVLINLELIRASVSSFDIPISVNIHDPIALKGITKEDWKLEQLLINQGGNIEAKIINEKGNFKIIYLGRFNKSDCSFKENPLEASIYIKIYRFDSLDGVVSYPPFGGHLYFDAEKSQYTIDVLGTIRNTNFPSDNRVISWVNGNEFVRYLDFLNNVPDGKGESGFAYFQFFSASYRAYESLPDFFKRDGAVIFAIQRNFGDGQVFMFKGFKDNKPILESIPFRISADGIVSDIREKVTLKDGIQVPKLIFKIFFGSIYQSYSSDKTFLNTLGYRIREDDLRRF